MREIDLEQSQGYLSVPASPAEQALQETLREIKNISHASAVDDRSVLKILRNGELF